MLETSSLVVRHPNVYVDVSAYCDRYHYFPWDIYTLDKVEHKVLFASDYPLVSFANTINALEKVEISPEFKKGILGENAQKLLGI